MLFFYVRHGDPIYDPDQLTPLGHRQAEAIGRRLARYGLDEIYVSSSTRAQETVQPVCELLKKKATVLDWTNEAHAWRELTLRDDKGRLMWGFCTPQVRDLFTSREIQRMAGDWYQHPFFQNNTIPQGYLRIRGEARKFMEQLGFAWDDEKGQYKNLHYQKKKEAYTIPEIEGKRVALYAHHGFGMAFLSCVLDIPYPYVCEKMDLGHSSMTCILFRENQEYVIPQMLTLSNDGHLMADNLPTRYNNEYCF